MEFNDNIDYAEVFGEASEGAEETAPETDVENAAGGDDTLVGGNGEAAEDGASMEGSAEPSEDSGDDIGSPETTREGVQSPEENARFAAARRDAERQRDAAIAAEREASRKAMEDVFASLGMVNPYTGKPIRSKEEFDAYRVSHDEAQKKQFMQTYNMDEEEYNSMLNQLPEVRAAREVAERARMAENESKRESAKAHLDEQVREISKLDPEIKTVDDIIKHNSYKEVLKKVKSGYSVLDAYRVVNFERLTKNASAAARQQVMNAHSGKEHLMQTAQRGTGIEMVPSDVRQMYRDINPEMSDAEIAKEYAKYANQTRKK